MTIEPSFVLQLEGLLAVTLAITGVILSVKLMSALLTTQVPPTFLTLISYGLPDASKPVNTFDDW